MTDNNEETITLSVKRSTLNFLFAGGNHLDGNERPLSATLALNVIDHAAWLTNVLARGADEDDPRNHYADQQLQHALELIRAIEKAEVAR